MKIREEDFDVNEGLDRYKNDKLAASHEKFLKNNPQELYRLLCLATDEAKSLSFTKVLEVVLKGEYNPGIEDVLTLSAYPEGYIEVEVNSKTISIRWDNDWFSIS